jgi:hypothetical protein
MARTTTRRPQAPKRDRRCVVIGIDRSEHPRVIDANVRKHWRKIYCRDRNVGVRGAEKDFQEESRSRRRDARLESLYLKENLSELAFEPLEEYFDEMDEYNVRACGCVGTQCSYPPYDPFDDFDDTYYWNYVPIVVDDIELDKDVA